MGPCHSVEQGAQSNQLSVNLPTGLCSPCRKRLLEAAGFNFSRLIQTRGIFSLVEAVPVPIPKQKTGSQDSGSRDVRISLKTKRLKEYGVINVDLDLEPEP